MPPQTIAYLCLVVGLSMVAGWVVAFRNRPYLGLLGLSFLSLAGYVLAREAVRRAQEARLSAPGLTWLEVAALVATLLLFVASFWAAVQESRRRMREVREHFRAAEDAFTTLMEAERRKAEREERDNQ